MALRFTVTDLIHRCDHVLGIVRHKRETVTITRRGRDVAILSPCEPISLLQDPAQAAAEATSEKIMEKSQENTRNG